MFFTFGEMSPTGISFHLMARKTMFAPDQLLVSPSGHNNLLRSLVDGRFKRIIFLLIHDFIDFLISFFRCIVLLKSIKHITF